MVENAVLRNSIKFVFELYVNEKKEQNAVVMLNEENVKLSIIIPVYKIKEIYLRQCIECCINQTYRNIEIILVDDGSPDNCGAICDEYAAIDNRILVIHKENRGVSSARNIGIERSTGDYITFLDSDDWIEADTCEKIVNAVGQKNIDLIIFLLVKEYAGEKIFSKNLYEDKSFFDETNLNLLRRDVLEKSLDKNVLRMTFCKAIRADVLKEHKVYFDEKIPLCEDVVFWFEAFQHIHNAIYLNSYLYHYRQVENSATDQFRPNAEHEHEVMLNKLSKLIEYSENPEIYQTGFNLEVFYSMQRCITQLYFHPNNPEKYLTRVRACHINFANEPYSSSIKEIDTNLLIRNHKIKYYMMRIKLYGLVQETRKIYMRLTGKNLS